MKKNVKKIIFPTKISMGKRPWGKEDLLVLIPKILTLKKIFIKKGSKGGLQYHRKKMECGYLVKGKLLVRFASGNGKIKKKILNPGSHFYFPKRLVHQEEAIKDCVIIEASSPHFNDRVRVEKEYNLMSKEGLPSTKLKDIKFV